MSFTNATDQFVSSKFNRSSEGEPRARTGFGDDDAAVEDPPDPIRDARDTICDLQYGRRGICQTKRCSSKTRGSKQDARTVKRLKVLLYHGDCGNLGGVYNTCYRGVGCTHHDDQCVKNHDTHYDSTEVP